MKSIFMKYWLFFNFLVVCLSMFVVQSCETNDDLDRINVTPQEQPTITSVEPTTAVVGSEVTITGTNFRADIDQNVVRFNEAKATILSSTPTTLVVIVPSRATSGIIEVSVLNFSVSGPAFTVEPPAPIITSFDPITGGVSSAVTIMGMNFSDNPNENKVVFNNTMTVVTASSSTSITTSVPVGASTGPISVTTFGKTATSAENFVIRDFTTIMVPIISDEDDVEEVVVLDPEGSAELGQMDIGSSDLELGEFSSGDGLQDIGVRFVNVSIPPGADITEAYIQFRCDDTGSDPVEMSIYCESVGNAAPYTSDAFNLTSRALTTAHVVWSIPQWINKGDRLPAQRTVNLAPIVQEVINRTDWVSGNSINFVLKNTGVSASADSSSGGRETENYSSSKPEDGAELSVTFR